VPETNFEWSLAHPEVIGARERREIDIRTDMARTRLATVRHNGLPAATELHLALEPPAAEPPAQTVAPGLSSPLLEEARQLKVFEDFKYLTDLRRRPGVEIDPAEWRTRLGDHTNLDPEARRRQLQAYVEHHYEMSPPAADLDPALVTPR
jgi:hypothetical protein